MLVGRVGGWDMMRIKPLRGSILQDRTCKIIGTESKYFVIGIRFLKPNPNSSKRYSVSYQTDTKYWISVSVLKETELFVWSKYLDFLTEYGPNYSVKPNNE